MAKLEMGDQIADETGSGNDFLLDLDIPLDPAERDAALILVCHEPLYLAETYYIPPPDDETRRRHITSEVYLPDETEPYFLGSFADIGFGEYRYLEFARNSPAGTADTPDIDGLPATAALVVSPPDGFAATAYLVAPEPGGAVIDQLLIHFDKLFDPRSPQDVDWFSVKAWHMLNFNPDHENLIGTTGRRSTEPSVQKIRPSTQVLPHNPGDLAIFSAATGETSNSLDYPLSVIVFDGGTGVEVTSDGGDVGGSGATSDIGRHVLDVALAGRWGSGGAGSWTWADDYPWTLLGTVDRDQPDGNHAHVEFFYRILDPPAASSYSADGTFGTQTVSGTGNDSTFRYTGGLLRAASINSLIKPGGGYLPQIYRRMVEVEVG